ncbi:MAG: hypothetical protein Q8R24_08170 [Legionellaceae bacterium]|nr:hypothetical protein [Legionellaceae bacterium]
MINKDDKSFLSTMRDGSLYLLAPVTGGVVLGALAATVIPMSGLMLFGCGALGVLPLLPIWYPLARGLHILTSSPDLIGRGFISFTLKLLLNLAMGVLAAFIGLAFIGLCTTIAFNPFSGAALITAGVAAAIVVGIALLVMSRTKVHLYTKIEQPESTNNIIDHVEFNNQCIGYPYTVHTVTPWSGKAAFCNKKTRTITFFQHIKNNMCGTQENLEVSIHTVGLTAP